MTVGAGLAGVLGVLLVAREATQAFMDSKRRAVVAGSGLGGGQWRVTLIAEGLARIGAQTDSSRAIEYCRQRKNAGRNIRSRPAVEETERRTRPFFGSADPLLDLF